MSDFIFTDKRRAGKGEEPKQPEPEKPKLPYDIEIYPQTLAACAYKAHEMWVGRFLVIGRERPNEL